MDALGNVLDRRLIRVESNKVVTYGVGANVIIILGFVPESIGPDLLVDEVQSVLVDGPAAVSVEVISPNGLRNFARRLLPGVIGNRPVDWFRVVVLRHHNTPLLGMFNIPKSNFIRHPILARRLYPMNPIIVPAWTLISAFGAIGHVDSVHCN